MAKNQKLIVEVVDARDLLPKDGHGTSSPYVTVDFHGQKKRTHTVIRDLNPTWNEVLEFNVVKSPNVFGNNLEIDVYHDKNHGPTTRNNFLGRIRLSATQFVKKGEEALIYYPLQKKQLFSWIQGEIGLKIYYQDEVVPPPPPPATPLKEEEKAETKTDLKPEPETEAAEPEVRVQDDTKPNVPEPEVTTVETSPSAPTPAPAPEVSAAETSQPSDTAASPIEEEKQQEPNIPTPPPPPTPQPQPKPRQPESTQEDTFDMVVEPPLSLPERMASAIPEVKSVGVTAPALPIRTISSPASINYTLLESQESSASIERSSFDLVEKMHYLFVRVIKARFLPTNRSPIVSISVSSHRISTKPARKTGCFEWEETFAFSRESSDSSSSSILEVSIWDPQKSESPNFLGGICFDVSEIPLRDPPDSPLAPQWYRLEGGGSHRGDLMLATWIGTQADESFPDAWKTTDTANIVNSRAKVYLCPKLWYLRATVLEAQDVMTSSKDTTWQVKVQLASQVQKTKPVITRNGNLTWNEDLLFVAAEPFSDQSLVFSIENRQPKGPVIIGAARIPLTRVERRVDDRKVAARWLPVEDPKSEKVDKYNGRIQLRLCFDGGYHVMDEAAHVCSDYRPTARQLWKPPVGVVELGIIGCKNLLPVKTVAGKGCVDSYCVAKYGPKWVRTRTVCESLDPKWNEQYTWKVYDPCTVLTIGVFDSAGVGESDGEKSATCAYFRIGKVRIRISTLETGKVYKHVYPLTVLTSVGVKTMGEIELAVRFVRATPTLDLLHVYSQPLLPLMHHIRPLGVVQQEMLRSAAAKIIALHLSRSEPPLRREVVLCMLDADSHTFSMRKVRANYCRIINVIAGVIDIVRWVENTRLWKNPTATTLVHALLVMLVWFPDLIVPSLAFYVFVIGAWNYRFRSRESLPHLDPKISLADVVDRDELDEEFDTMPSCRSAEIVRARYDKLRAIGIRVQTILGDFATQGERVQALVTWRDPRATGIFVGLCFVVAMILYLVPSKMIAMAFMFYYFRHPIFRDKMPSPALNFFRRLPSLADRIL